MSCNHLIPLSLKQNKKKKTVKTVKIIVNIITVDKSWYIMMFLCYHIRDVRASELVFG